MGGFYYMSLFHSLGFYLILIPFWKSAYHCIRKEYIANKQDINVKECYDKLVFLLIVDI